MRGSVGDGARARSTSTGTSTSCRRSRAAQFRPRGRTAGSVGRGSADMKGGLVSMLYGAAAARELGLLGDGRIVLHLVCDEETGSVTGSGHLREAGHDRRRCASRCSPPSRPAASSGTRAAARSRCASRCEGRAGARRPGASRRERVRADGADRRAARRPRARAARAPHGLPARRATRRAARCSSWAAPRAAARTSTSCPGTAWFSVDRRFNPEEDLAEEVARLTRDDRRRGRRARRPRSAIDVLQRAAVRRHRRARIPPRVALARCVAAVEGAAPRFELCPGVLETRWYAQLGIPAFAYGAGRLDVSHGPGRVHRRGRDAPLRRGLRAVRGRPAPEPVGGRSRREPAAAWTAAPHSRRALGVCPTSPTSGRRSSPRPDSTGRCRRAGRRRRRHAS